MGNRKLAPAEDYAFDSFSSAPGPATITLAIVYGTGGYEAAPNTIAYRIYAHTGDGWGNAYTEAVVKSDGSLRAFKVTVAWDAVEGADKYLVLLVGGAMISDYPASVQTGTYFRVVTAATAFTDDFTGWSVSWGFGIPDFGDGDLAAAFTEVPPPIARLQELNRIRRDLFKQRVDAFQDSGLTSYRVFPKALMTSAGECVGTNPCQNVQHWGKLYLTEYLGLWNAFTYDASQRWVPGAAVYYAGAWYTCLLPNNVLEQHAPDAGDGFWELGTGPSAEFTLFKNLKFLFASSEEDFTSTNPDNTNDIPYIDNFTVAAALFWGVKMTTSPLDTLGNPHNLSFTEPYTGADPNRTFTHTVHYNVPVDCTLYLVLKIPLQNAGADPIVYHYEAVVQNLVAGAGTFDITYTGFWRNDPPGTGASVTVDYTAEFFFPADTVRTIVDKAIHPSDTVYQLAATEPADWNIFRKFALADVSGSAPFDVWPNGFVGFPFITVNLPRMRGMWQADTLPTPANNLYLDADFPPYVTQLMEDEAPDTANKRIVATCPVESTYGHPRSSMRYPTPTGPVVPPEIVFVDVPLAAGADYKSSLYFPDLATLLISGVPAGTDPLLVLSETLTIYVSRTNNINPADAGTYGFSVVGQLNFADVRAYYDGSTDELTADGRTLYFLARNTGGNIAHLFVIINEYTPFAINRVDSPLGTTPAVWPVIRDTDFYPWYSGLDIYRTKGDFVTAHSLANNATWNTSAFFPGTWNYYDWKLSITPVAGTVTVYVSNVAPPDPTTPGSYIFSTTTGTVQMSDLVALGLKFGAVDGRADQTLFFTVKNASGAAISLTETMRTEKLNYKNARQALPVFNPIGLETDEHEGVFENWSASLYPNWGIDFFGTNASFKSNLVPQRGYQIYSIYVRRLPIEAYAATATLPSQYQQATDTEDLPELTIKIGQYKGLAHTSFEKISVGTFTELATVTIAEGEVAARVSVSLPVLYGAHLVYKRDAAPLYVVGSPAGLLTVGNIDLNARPIAFNDDGSISTVRSISIEESGVQILIPTVGLEGEILSDPDAVTLYHTTGLHLGKFDTEANVDAYAEALHEYEDEFYLAPLVRIEALVKFQPTFHNLQNAGLRGSDNSDAAGFWSGELMLFAGACMRTAFRFQNLYDASTNNYPHPKYVPAFDGIGGSADVTVIQYPMAAQPLVDLIAALTALPDA